MLVQGQEITTYVFDLDGVMYLGETAIPHAAEAVRRLTRTGRRVFFLTNNSGRTRRDYQEKLVRVNGLDIAEEQIYTSAYATALYLKARGAAGRSVFVIGEIGLARELADSGGLVPVTVADSVPFEAIDYVVVGIDKQFTYDKLRFAHAAITRGHAQFIATNRDSTFPMEDGEIPGGGSLVAALATAAGREPLTVGKPEPHAYEAILQAAGVPAGQSVMVGDRLDTDIAVGNRAGAHTVLVLTGVTDSDAAANAPSAWRPERIIGDLRALD
ncbi:MAG: phosphoglycolate/pyridoxal phosphate family phosphatase [Armatimonadetes bacterium]|nr:phosphoglycolate/pyridoxal phosphate family phosphatase [Armatimonadota bacterium]